MSNLGRFAWCKLHYLSDWSSAFVFKKKFVDESCNLLSQMVRRKNIVLIAAFSGCFGEIGLAAERNGAICSAVACPHKPAAEAMAAPLAREAWLRENDRVERVRNQIEAGKVDLLFLGDSLTAEWTRVIWNQSFAHYNALNLGMRGDTTQNLLWRLQQGQWGQGTNALRPRLVVLMIGTNNLGAGSTGADVALGVKAILDFIHWHSPSSRILLLAIWPRRGNPRLQKAREQANALLQLCADATAVRVLNLADTLTDANGELLPDLFRDRLHLNDAGYAAILKVLAPVVALMMAEEPGD